MDYCELVQLTGREPEGQTPGLTGYLPQVTSDEDKAKLAEIIARVSRRIDAYVTDGHETDYFAPSPSEPSARIMRGSGDSFLELPEFVAGSVADVTAPEGFTVPAWEEEGRLLVIVTGAGVRTRRQVWREGVPYAVTARWGRETMPLDVTEACLQLVVRTYRKADDAFSGVIGDIQTDSAVIEKAMPIAVKDILDVHRRRYRARRLVFA